jgi:Ran GTPase-activating protein (RanGAP) involved in mRNA processing and transport
LRAREGEAVEWTRRVAQRAGTLKDMMDDAPTEDGVYPVPMIAAAELAVLQEMCEADSMPARLEQCSISELFRLVEGASFLDAPGALDHAQRALATRLNGKRADALRELLGATDDFGSAEERVAALAEPAFSPGGQLSEATVGSAGGAPALQPQLTLWMAVTDDAKEVALGMVDVGTLAELKGVSRSWLALARRVLCSRLSRCEGQPAPTQLAEITDLNIKVLVDAGRPWEAAVAGRMLPSLARLRWEGFEVSVAAVREVDLDERDEDEDEDEDERPFLGGPAKTALLSCIEGEGEPPLELLLAAVACAGSGEIRGMPVQMMRDDSVSELDLRESNIGVEGGMLLAYLVPVMGGLTKMSLAKNVLGEEGTKAICEALEQNKTLKELDIRGAEYKGNIGGSAGAKHVAKMLGVNGALTKLSLAQNKLDEEGTKAICEALEQNMTLKELDISGDWQVSNTGGSAGAKHVAKIVRVNGALTSLDLSSNQLCGLDHFGRGTYTAEGITAIADALRVNGGLTKLSLAVNRLGEEGNKAICKALEQNTTLKELDISHSEIGGSAGAKDVAKMVGVNGGLTSLNLSSNDIGCYWDDEQKTLVFTPEGPTALADALFVNGALTRIDVRSNHIVGDGAKHLSAAVLGNLKIEMFNEIPIKEMRADSFTELDLRGKGVGVEGGMVVAGLIAVMGGLTALDLSFNDLKDEGVSAVCKAIQNNKETKLASLNVSGNCIGPVGANAVAAMVAFTGGLTSLNLSSNQLCGLDGFGVGTYTTVVIAAIADALRVNGGLTSINLSGNHLTNFGTDMTGIKELAAALGVNGALTKIE